MKNNIFSIEYVAEILVFQYLTNKKTKLDVSEGWKVNMRKNLQYTNITESYRALEIVAYSIFCVVELIAEPHFTLYFLKTAKDIYATLAFCESSWATTQWLAEKLSQKFFSRQILSVSVEIKAHMEGRRRPNMTAAALSAVAMS